MTLMETVKQEKLIVIVRGVESDRLLPLAEALYTGGIRLLEITYDAKGVTSDEDTANNIQMLAKAFEGRMYIGAGYTLAREKGLHVALFKTRVYSTLCGGTALETYSFFLGAVLQGEVDLILKADIKDVVLGGKPQLAKATACLLENTDLQVYVAAPDAVANSTVRGALRIYGS